jgi:hypothetical protein
MSAIMVQLVRVLAVTVIDKFSLARLQSETCCAELAKILRVLLQMAFIA